MRFVKNKNFWWFMIMPFLWNQSFAFCLIIIAVILNLPKLETLIIVFGSFTVWCWLWLGLLVFNYHNLDITIYDINELFLKEKIKNE